MLEEKLQLGEKKKRQTKQRVKKAEEHTPPTLDERVENIENMLKTENMMNANFALSSFREMTNRIQGLQAQVNIMGGYLEEKELIDDCNSWYENKIEEETKRQQEMIEKAKADRIAKLKEEAEKMKTADKKDQPEKKKKPTEKKPET